MKREFQSRLCKNEKVKFPRVIRLANINKNHLDDEM